MSTEDRFVIVCNYAEGTKIAPDGARAYVALTNPGDGDPPTRIEVLVRSHGGRLVRKWENMARLTNFRLKQMPPEHPRFDDERLWDGDVDDVIRLNTAPSAGSKEKP